MKRPGEHAPAAQAAPEGAKVFVIGLLGVRSRLQPATFLGDDAALLNDVPAEVVAVVRGLPRSLRSLSAGRALPRARCEAGLAFAERFKLVATDQANGTASTCCIWPRAGWAG